MCRAVTRAIDKNVNYTNNKGPHGGLCILGSMCFFYFKIPERPNKIENKIFIVVGPAC